MVGNYVAAAKYLDEDRKADAPYKGAFGEGQQVSVPEPIAKPIQDLTYLAQRLPKAQAKEIIAKVTDAIEKQTARIQEKNPELAKSYERYVKKTKQVTQKRRQVKARQGKSPNRLVFILTRKDDLLPRFPFASQKLL